MIRNEPWIDQTVITAVEIMGPTNRAPLKIMALREMAVVSNSRGTKLGARDNRAGWLMPIAHPVRKVKMTRCQTFKRPEVDKAKSTSADNAATTCAQTITKMRLCRSAKAPPKGPNKITGAKSAIAMMPNQAGEWVNSHVSQPTAIRCIQVPINDRPLPKI